MSWANRFILRSSEVWARKLVRFDVVRQAAASHCWKIRDRSSRLRSGTSTNPLWNEIMGTNRLRGPAFIEILVILALAATVLSLLLKRG
jgi:hypothetical protein